MSPKAAKHLVLLLAATLGSCAVLSTVFDTRKLDSNAQTANANVTYLSDLPIPEGVADSEASQYRQGNVVRVGGLRLFIPLAYQTKTPREGDWQMGFVWPSFRGIAEWNRTHNVDQYARPIMMELASPYGWFRLGSLSREDAVINRSSASEAEADFRYLYSQFSITSIHPPDDERGRVILEANPASPRMHPVVMADRFRMMQTRDGAIIHEKCPSVLENTPSLSCRSTFRHLGMAAVLAYPRDANWLDVHDQVKGLLERLLLPGSMEISAPYNTEPLGPGHLPDGPARDAWFPARHPGFPVPDGVSTDDAQRWYRSGRLKAVGGRTYFIPRAYDGDTSSSNTGTNTRPLRENSISFQAAWPALRGESEWRYSHGLWATVSPLRVSVIASPFSSSNHNSSYDWGNRAEAMENFTRMYGANYAIRILSDTQNDTNAISGIVAEAIFITSGNAITPMLGRLIFTNGRYAIELCDSLHLRDTHQSCSSSFMWNGLAVIYRYPGGHDFRIIRNWAQSVLINMQYEGINP